MMIFDTEPVTWQELEDMVCQAFEEMGYESSRNQEILTARGKVRIDVRAVKRSNPIPTLILCECKHWNKPVNQNVILSFRTICSDVGAHYGLVISKEGFQMGAKGSREHTNIHLLNFVQFQSTFFDEWRNGIFMRFAEMSNSLPLMTMTITPLSPSFAAVKMFEKYEVFGGGDRSYHKFFIERGKFPVRITDPRGDPHVFDHIVVRSPRQYFEIAKRGCEDARRYFKI
jgi:hypothetical protein